MDCFNIHTHTSINPESEIISYSPGLHPTDPRIVYSSIGIHPWYLTEDNAETQWNALLEQISSPTTIAIGEGGLDKLKGPSLDTQIRILKQQALLSEEKKLPLILHCVKAYNELILLKKEIQPSQPWIIHGFRGKESLAIDCLRHGFYLSFGEHFQADALRAVPINKLFIETDESKASIETIYQSIAKARHISLEELNESIKKNVKEVFFKA